MIDNRIIQGLWIGRRLSAMQQLSIKSFLANAHEYHLYAYDELFDVPEGVTMKNANDIMPAWMVFKNRDGDTYAAFSDFFRYKLLLEKGGWWADLDLICLRHFDFPSEYVFSSEHRVGNVDSSSVDLSRPIIEVGNSGAIKSPPSAPLMAEAWATCCSKDPSQLTWGEVGPVLMRELISKYNLDRFVQNAACFCPVPSFLSQMLFDPRLNFIINNDVYAIHLWHELSRRMKIDGDRSYDPECLYERLKAQYM